MEQKSFDLTFLNNFGADLEDKKEALNKQYHQAIGFFNGLNVAIDVIKALRTDENAEELNKVERKISFLKDKSFQDTLESKARETELESVLQLLKLKIQQHISLMTNPNIGVRPEDKKEKIKMRRKEKVVG